MRLSFLKKCHKVRLLLAALCGLALTSHLDAVKKDVVKTANDLKLLTAQVQREMTHPTAHLKKVKANYKQLRHAKIQAGNPEEAKSIREMIDTMGAAIQRAKAHGPEHLQRSLTGLNPLKSHSVAIDIMSGASTHQAAAAKHKPPKSHTLLGGKGHGVLKTPTKPKKTKPPIRPKPSPQKIAENRLKNSHQQVVNTLKTHHAQTEVAAAKANLAKVNAEIAHEEMMENLSEHSSTSPTHTSPTHTPTSEPVAPEPADNPLQDNTTSVTPPPPPLPPAPTLAPTTPQRPKLDLSSASAFAKQRLKLKPTPKKESPPPSKDSPDLQTAIHAALADKFENANSDSEDDDDKDSTTDGGWDDNEDKD